MLANDHTSDFILPNLDYDYGALAPVISAEIMQLHHTKHHQTYVNNLNLALERYHDAEQKHDLEAMISLQPVIRFNGGGHINHTLFWKMLAPISQGGGGQPHGPLKTLIQATFGSFENFIQKMNQATVAIQGSGWGWLCYDSENKKLIIQTCLNQDPIIQPHFTGLLGIDVWEHAYYLQYKNARAEYLNNIWKVINWRFVEERFENALNP
jgi:Fe-Mn family superoxide dismutase